jgi:hypothetical protein
MIPNPNIPSLTLKLLTPKLFLPGLLFLTNMNAYLKYLFGISSLFCEAGNEGSKTRYLRTDGGRQGGRNDFSGIDDIES